MRNEFANYRKLHLNSRFITPGFFNDASIIKTDESELFSFLKDWFNDDEYIELKTSGSTGEPSIIVVYKDAMVASAKKTIGFFGLKSNMTALLSLPVSFIAGKMMVVRAMVGEMHLISVQPSSNPLLNLTSIIDFAAFTPMQMIKILEQSPEKSKLLRTIILGGGKVDERLENELQKISFDAWETFGMTETLSHIALRKINGEDKQSCFFPLIGISVAVDKRGCLLIDYPDVTPNTIVTNDIAEIFSNGSFKISGRTDSIINSGGIKISPEQVEEKIRHLIQTPFIISSVRDPVFGEKLILVIEGNLFDTGCLMESISDVVGSFEKPVDVRFVNHLPRTENGKIQRFMVKELVRYLNY